MSKNLDLTSRELKLLTKINEELKDFKDKEKINKFIKQLLENNHDRVINFFNNINDIVYLSDPNTYEIVFINKTTQKYFGDIVGKKCYEQLQNKDSPCSFCTNPKIFAEDFEGSFIWEFHNEKVNQYYKCIDSTIDWFDGRKLRFEIARNITKEKIVEKANNFIKNLAKKTHDCKSVNNLMDTILTELHHKFAFRFNLALKYNSSQNTLTIINNKPHKKYSEIKLQTTKQEVQKPIINYIEKEKSDNKSPIIDYLHNHGIKYYISMPLRNENEIFGLIILGDDREHYITEENSSTFLSIVENINLTLQKKIMEINLRRTKQEYMDIFQQNLDGIGITDLDGYIVNINPAMEKLLGYSLDEIKKHTFYDITVEKWHDIEKKIVEEQFLKQGFTQEYEKEYYHKDGSIIPVALKGWTIYDENNKPLYLGATIRDLRERKLSELKLKESKERYQKLYDDAPVGLFRSDLKTGKIIDVNKTTLSILGYDSKEEMINTKFSKEFYVTPSHRDKMTDMIQKEGMVKEFITQVFRKDKSKVWIKFSAVLDKEQDYLEGSLEDITKEKINLDFKNLHHNLSLRLAATNNIDEASEIILDTFLELDILDSGGIYIRNDEQKIFKLINYKGFGEDYVKDVIIVPFDDVRGKMMKKGKAIYVSIDDYKNKRPVLTNEGLTKIAILPIKIDNKIMFSINLASHDVHHFNQEIKDNFTTIKNSLINILDRILSQQELNLYKLQLEDIVEKRTKELAESNKQLQNLYDLAPVGLFLTSVNKAGFLRCNDKLATILGYNKAEEIMDMSVTEFYATDDGRTKFLEEFGKAGIVRNYKTQIIRKDGELRWININAHLHIDNDTIEGAVIDITDLVLIQNELERTLKTLQLTNDELKQFAYVASHDLQEPLRMVSSYLQLISQGLGDELSEELKEYIVFALDGSKRMKELINDLLVYSRVTTREPKKEIINIDKFFNELLADLKISIEESNATISFDNLPSTLKGDKSQIKQLFQNLISNSIKFRKEKVPPKIKISYNNEPNYHHFILSDNGIGINPDYHDTIFVIFQRLHSKRDYDGSGIGLAICKKIVERYDGRIWAESDGKNGSKFHFTLKKDN